MRWWPMTMECPPGMARARNGERGCDYPPGGQARQQYNVLQNRFAPGGPAMSTATAATLLVQSGKPVGVVRTHELAPRVLIAHSLLVPKWATWEEFRRLEQMGLP